MRILTKLRTQISLVQVRHYFLSCCVLLLWVTIGFLIVTQSQADEGVGQILIDTDTYSQTPLSLRGPQNELPKVVYPLQKMNNNSAVSNIHPHGSKAYETILRRSLAGILDEVQERCWLWSQAKSFEHIESILENDTDVWSVLDAWCITDFMATKYEYDDPLIATKLPFIRVLAIYHAWSREKVRQAVRQIPLESKFSDQSTWWSWSDIVLYAEYQGLLDRVIWEELNALQGFSSQELSLLFGDDSDFSEKVFLHELLEHRIELQNTTYLENILLYHPTNQRILRTVLTRIARSSSTQHKALLKKLLSWITQESDEILQLKKRIEWVL
jgi:hypothetical protein